MPLNYSYVPNVPQGNQQVNKTQSPIRDNFYDIYDLVGVNHIEFNTADTFGRHNIVSYVEQGTDPDTADNEMVLYSKAVVNDPRRAEMFYRYPSNGTVVQLTGIASKASSYTSNSGSATGGYWYASGTVAYGYPVRGWWQYLSNNIFIQTFVVSNYNPTSGTTSPFTVYFPSGSYTGGVTPPTFSATPFNIQLSSGSQQGGTGGDYMFSCEIVDTTTALVYYAGDFIQNSTTSAIFLTVIGV